VQQKAVKLDGEAVTSIDVEIVPRGEQVLQVGKRRFLRIVEG
jgi:tyrosyl-tRNA synthetase